MDKDRLLNQSLNHPAYLMPQEPKLALRNKHLCHLLQSYKTMHSKFKATSTHTYFTQDLSSFSSPETVKTVLTHRIRATKITQRCLTCFTLQFNQWTRLWTISTWQRRAIRKRSFLDACYARWLHQCITWLPETVHANTFRITKTLHSMIMGPTEW